MRGAPEVKLVAMSKDEITRTTRMANAVNPVFQRLIGLKASRRMAIQVTMPASTGCTMNIHLRVSSFTIAAPSAVTK